MFGRLKTLLLIFTLANSAFAQKVPPQKLVYLYDTTNTFLIPNIEDILRTLTYPKSTKKIFQDPIISLNLTIDARRAIQAEILERLATTRGNYMSAETRRLERVILSELDKANYILKIKINKIERFIEIQFSLFNVYCDSNCTQTVSYNKSLSLFIDPEKDNHRQVIANTLRQLFPQANNPPDFEISAYPTTSIDSIYYITENQKITFKPIVYDNDSPDDQMTYNWFQSDEERKTNLAPINRFEKSQSFIGLAPGKYRFSFNVSDGIDTSRTELITFCVYQVPKLFWKDTLLNLKRKNFYSFKSSAILAQNTFFVKNSLVNLPTFSYATNLFRQQAEVGSDFTSSLEFLNRDSILVYRESIKTKDLPTQTLFFENFLDSIATQYFDKKLTTLRMAPPGKYILKAQIKNNIYASAPIFRDVNFYKYRILSFRYAFLYFPWKSRAIERTTSVLSYGVNFSLASFYWFGVSYGLPLNGNNLKKYLVEARVIVRDFDIKDLKVEIGTLINKEEGFNSVKSSLFVRYLYSFMSLSVGAGIHYKPYRPIDGERRWLYSISVSSDILLLKRIQKKR
ncbi:hypothetical protein [Dyadobacter frigoris]|uniref:Uncharacterized protein n=1 Tax=Dyadobacter frigoris TaxID=2576211 RepID=A0A4U6CMZ3_9BACT|nr:hypothetical protein [Dyadobacter frigoris]TKT85730.1 hypothetical protein FDK13_33390 [Dyadobacter frigoris]